MYNQEKHDTYLSVLDQNFEDFFSKFFDDSRRNLKTLSKNTFYPKVDIYTKDDNYFIVSTIPGVTQKNLKIEIDDKNVLTISGKMSLENIEDVNFHVKELKRSAFSRMFVLPYNLIGDPEVVFNNCILKLTWKCKAEQKKIDVSNKKVIEINPRRTPIEHSKLQDNFLLEQYMSGLITRDDYEFKTKETKECKLKEARDFIERDIIKYEIFNEMGLVNLPKEISDKIALYMTNGKAYGIFEEVVCGRGGNMDIDFNLSSKKELHDTIKMDYGIEHDLDGIQTFYSILNDIGEKAVVPAYCFDAISSSITNDCEKMFNTFSDIKDKIGVSCDKIGKYKKSTEQFTLTDICFNGKETNYPIKPRGNIIPSTLSGSVYIGSSLVCKFMSTGNLNSLTLVHTNNDIKVKNIKLVDNVKNIDYNLKIDWFIVPGKTKISLDYDYEYEISNG